MEVLNLGVPLAMFSFNQQSSKLNYNLTNIQIAALEQGHSTQINGFTHYHFSGVSFNYRKPLLRSESQPPPRKYTIKNKKKNIASIRCDVGFDWDNIDLLSCCFPQLPAAIEEIKKRRKLKNVPFWNPVFDHLTDLVDPELISVPIVSKYVWLSNIRKAINKKKHAENGNIFRKFNNNWYFDSEQTFHLIDFTTLSGNHHTINYIQRESPHFYDVCYIGRHNNVHLISIPYWAMSTQYNTHGRFSLLQIQALLANHMHDFVRICDLHVLPIVLFLKKYVHLPYKQSNVEMKEDTKRDSRTHRSQLRTRIDTLSNSHPEYARKLEDKQKYNLKNKRQNAAHKATMLKLFPVKHSATDPGSLNFFKDDTTQIFLDIEKLINDLPPDLLKLVAWTEALGSVYVLMNNPCYVAKAISAKALYRHFGIQGFCIATFTKLTMEACKFFFSRDPSLPVKQSEMQSSLATLITLILSLLYQRKASDGHVNACLKSLSSIPNTARGLDCVMSALDACIRFVRREQNPFDFAKEIKEIEDKVKYYATPEGNARMAEDVSCFTELAELEIRSINLLKFIPNNSVHRLHFSGVASRLNAFYRRVQMSPPAGHGNRKPPVTLHLWGLPGVGKTHLLNLISADAVQTILTLEGVEGEELYEKCKNFVQFVYYNPVANKYKTGFNSSTSKVLICDDANQVNAHFLTEGNPFPVDLIHYANSHTHLLNVAEVENKRNALFNSSLIIATDNDKYPDLDYLANKDAYKRRLDLQFQVLVKPEYTKMFRNVRVVDDDKLDVSKVNSHIYDFVANGTHYTYDQMIDLLNTSLKKKHNKFIHSIKAFSNYAVRNLETGPSVPKLFPIGSRSISQVLYDRAKEEQTAVLLDDGVQRLARFYDYESSDESEYWEDEEIKFEESLKEEKEGEEKDEAPAKHGLWNKAKRVGRIAQFEVLGRTASSHPFDFIRTRYYALMFWLTSTTLYRHPFLTLYIYCVLAPYENFRTRFLTRDKKKDKQRINQLLTALGILGLGYGAYKLGKKYTKRKRVINFKQANNDDDNDKNNDDPAKHKYDNGTAKGKPRQPPKPSPKTPIEARPMFPKQSDTRLEKYDAAEYARLSDKQLTSGKAYIMAKLLVSNMYLIQYCIKRADGVEVRTLRGFFVKGATFLTNKHLLDSLTYDEFSRGYFNLYNVFDTHMSLEARRVTVTLFGNVGEEDSNYDLISIDFKGCKVRDHVDITSVFPDHNGLNPIFVRQAQLNDIEGSRIMVITMTLSNQFDTKKELELTGKRAWYVEMQHTRILEVNKEALEAMNPSGEADYTLSTMTYNMQSVGGYCGSVVLLNTSELGGVICGIHMAGYCGNDTSYGQIITNEMIKTLNLEKQCKVLYRPLENPTTMLDTAFCAVGQIPHVLHSSSRTKIRPSRFHNKIFPTQKKPAHLGFFQGDHVMNMAMKKYLEPSVAVSSVHEAVFSGALNHRFNPTRKVRQLTYNEAISGIVGNEFIRGVNARTSAGYPFNKMTNKPGKTEYVGSDGNWIYDHPVLREHVENYTSSAEQNVRPECYFVTTAKDELRPCEKVDVGKTRAFAAAPLHFIILCRIFFLDLVANIMEERITNSSLIGINPYSDEWDYLVQRMINIANPNEELFTATDFTNWDGTMGHVFLWVLHSFIERCYARRDNKVTEALWRDITASLQIFGNVIFQIMRGQPSGNPLTAIINTLYNYALTFLAIWKLLDLVGTQEAHRLQEDLEKHFYVAIYGDDSIIAFSRELAALIDITQWSRVMEEMGHHCTPETKTGEIKLKTLSEISIIKRGFVYDKHLKHWLAPLELASIMEPLNWDKCRPEDKDEQMRTNSRTAIRELSMHIPQIFNEYRDKICEQCRIHGINLPPECYFDQTTLRQIVRRSEDVYYFMEVDNFSGVHKFNYNKRSSVSEDTLIVEKLNWINQRIFFNPINSKQNGSGIYHGGRHDSSPIKESHPKTMPTFYPTKHVQIRVAQSQKDTMTTQQYTDPSNQLPYHDSRNDTETGQQIITFATSEVPIVETLPMEADLHRAELNPMSEGRSHSIDDVLKREYLILRATIPVGGEAGEQLYLLDPIEQFLSQPNVLDKVNGFAFIRTCLRMRFEFTVAPKTSGGLIIAFYADMEDTAIDNRKSKLVQLSQTPNIRLSVTTSTSVIMNIPWVSNFIARNLQTGTGKPGKLLIGRLTPLHIGTVKVSVYIQADEKTLKIEYPTVKTPIMSSKDIQEKMRELQNELRSVMAEDEKKRKAAVAARPKIPRAAPPTHQQLPSKHMFKEVQKMNKEGIVSGTLSTGAKIATAASGLPLLGNATGSAAPILESAANSAAALGFSKPTNDTPLQAIRWKPGDGQLSSQTVLNSHIYSIDQENVIATNYPLFGSELDEMSVDFIMKSPNIIDDWNFEIKTSDEPGKILAKIPLVINPIVYDTNVYLSHQAWISQLCQNWIADLHYDFDVFLTMFHNVKLRLLVAPNVFDYAVGDNMPINLINKGRSEVIQFTGDKANTQIVVSPMQNTSMKFIPTPFGLDGTTVSDTILTLNQNTEFCSYGTLYVLVEVPLEAVGDVSPTIECVVSFHCTNVQLSNPSTSLSYLPIKHSCLKRGKIIKHSDVNLITGFDNNSRSTNLVRSAPMATNLTASNDHQRSVEISMGDRFSHLNKLLLAFTIFGPTHSLDNTKCLAVNPYQFRATVDSNYIDVIDYIACGFGFYTGHMAMRMLLYEKQGYVGESFIMSTFANQYKKCNSPTGWIIHSNADFLATGTRSVPHFAQEGIVDANVPYYQPFHIARVSHSDTYGSWNEGQLPVHWFFKSSVDQKVKMYRAIQDHFRFGFLTSLPPFKFQTGPIVRAS